MNKCKDCKKEKTCPSKEGSHKYCFEPKPQTNYDRIKSMSVEEIAQEMIFFTPECEAFHYVGLSGKYTATAEETIENNVKWLESEVRYNGRF